jgi:hypothetical protein
MPVFNVADASGGAGDPPAAVEPASILFPNESQTSTPAGEGTTTESGNTEEIGATTTTDDKGGDWKEYQNDATKTPEENATAKAAHDATKPADDTDPANVVPEDGKYTIAVPEGFVVDQKLVDALGPEFKEMGLTQGQAQKLADKFMTVKADEAKAQQTAWTKTVSQWADDAKADADMGGDKWDGTVSKAVKAMDALGTPALKKYLDASGGGNHPEIIRVFAKVGDMISEDSPPNNGAGGSGKPADPSHLLFPNDAPKGK